MNKAHKLKKPKTIHLPKAFIFFDIETTFSNVDEYFQKHSFKTGYTCFVRLNPDCSIRSETWKKLQTESDLFDFIEDRLKQVDKIYIFAHNIQFDLLSIRFHTHLTERHFRPVSFVFDNKVTVLTFKRNKKKILFIDSANFFQTSLEDLGKIIGLKKLEIDFETATDEYLDIYCKRDVEILKQSILNLVKIINKNKLCSFPKTAAQLSFKAYLHKFLKHDIFIHRNPEIEEIEREAYCGGRVECFFIGHYDKSNVYHYDVESMYPFVMKENFYPTKYITQLKNPPLSELKKILRNYLVIANLIIETEIPCIPVKLNQHLTFPTGSFETTLTTPELVLAFQKCKIIRINKLLVYEKAKIFTEFVDFFYRERIKSREENNKVYDYFYKIILNSLYGKFGQKNSEYTKIGEDEDSILSTETVYHADKQQEIEILHFCDNIYIKEKEKSAFNTFVAIPAHVTAYARVHLFNLMNTAGLENVLYCDTDSLFVTQTGHERLSKFVSKNTLGKLNLKESGDSIDIFNLKHYIFNNQEKCKGKSKNDIMIDDFTYEQTQWLTLKNHIRKNLTDGYYTRKVVKTIPTEYTKGIVTNSGKVIPFRLTL